MSDDKEYDYDFPRIPGITILPWLTWAAIIVAVIFATRAWGEEIPMHVVEHQAVKLRLMPGPCVDPVGQMFLTSQVPPQFHSRFKSISSDWRMQDGSWKEFAGCWIELTAQEANAPEPVIFMVFNDKATVAVPKSELLKQPGKSGA